MAQFGNVVRYQTGEVIRAATREELERSVREAEAEGSPGTGTYQDPETGVTVYVDGDPDALTEDHPAPLLALAAHLKADPGDIETLKYDDTSFSCDGAEYRVLTESERETAADEALESYIDDCMEIPEAIAPYFDRAKWKRDALMSDGYGHTLSPYDWEEHEAKIDGVWFYIYRTN